MPRKSRLLSRNAKVRNFFAEQEKKFPQWKLEALLEKTAEHFDISARTVSAIIKFEGVYKEE